MCQQCAEDPQFQAFLDSAYEHLLIALTASRRAHRALISAYASSGSVSQGALGIEESLISTRALVKRLLILHGTHDWDHSIEAGKLEVKEASAVSLHAQFDPKKNILQTLSDLGFDARLIETDGISMLSVRPRDEGREE